MKPVLLVIAGPNGSGKTTVTERLRADHWSEGVEYLNPDDVARDRFGDWNSPEATLEAARWTTARREALLESHQGIAFETVFSTDDKLDFVARAKAEGIYSSQLSTWRQQFGAGGEAGLTSRKPGRKPKLSARDREVLALTKKNEALEHELRVANALIELPKKRTRCWG